MKDGEELIDIDRVTKDNIHSLFQDLREFRNFKKKIGKWMTYEFLKLFQKFSRHIHQTTEQLSKN